MPDQINTRSELAKLVAKMAAEDTSKWDNSDLSSFLEALSGWIEDCDGYYSNMGSDLNPDSPSWQVFADALQAAQIYE